MTGFSGSRDDLRPSDPSGIRERIFGLAITSKSEIDFCLWPIEAVALQKTREKWGGQGRIRKFRK